MDTKVLTEIIHAQLHRHRRQLRIPEELTVREFMYQNKEVFQKIVQYLKAEFGVNISGLERLAMKDGIRNYLLAEGMSHIED
mgnify:FL=1|jgi:hypothetical protein